MTKRGLLPFALGDEPCDLVIRGAKVANLFSMELEDAEVAVKDGVIVGVGFGYQGHKTLDAHGMTLIPGMMDGHVHIESSWMVPSRFAEAVVPRGTSAVFADPHEIANVLGPEGVMGMFESSRNLPLDVYLGCPSCVPASEFETCKAPMGSKELRALRDGGYCQHLGEMMNYPGVLSGDREVWEKIQVFEGMPLTAHAPGLTGKELCAYVLSGCDGDHEATRLEEALEKLRRGYWVMMREGSAAPDLEALAPLVRDVPARCCRCMAVSDDLDARTLMERGHMDHKVRKLCALGVDPLVAVRMVTLSVAEYFGLKGRGAIAPGFAADMALVDSIGSMKVHLVLKDGRVVAEDGKLTTPPSSVLSPLLLSRGPELGEVDVEDLAVPAREGAMLRVILFTPGSLLTGSAAVSPFVEGGFVVPSREGDIAKLVCREHHRGTGRIGVGFVKGLGLRSGAFGSTVSHDAHNAMVAGMDDRSIKTVLDRLNRLGGGVVVAEGDKILAELPLPVGGLMCDMSTSDLVALQERVDRAIGDLGVSGPHPCMALSFLSLSVIPQLKLTDRGYVNLEEGGVVPLWV
ncbi:MAG: adenine deaminase [Thermanaerothrix sp.]|nr:adenine deaminase [Thermanaerothrix sp.]